MKLNPEQSWERLVAHDHAVLATTHARRGVDAVPVVYAALDEHVGIPVDTVKPKSSTRLQRERNLDADPRATLLIEHWDPADWSALWWVRVELHLVTGSATGADEHALTLAGTADDDRAELLADLLEEKYPQYSGRPFARVLVFRVVRLTGWSAAS